MKNNGKVRDVGSLALHWNISEMVYCVNTVYANYIGPSVMTDAN